MEDLSNLQFPDPALQATTGRRAGRLARVISSIQHVAVQEPHRVQSLIRGGGGYVLPDGQVGKKRLDFRFAHIFRPVRLDLKQGSC